MGQRMLANMTPHDQFEIVAAWDPDSGACAATAAQYPGVRIGADAQSVIADPASDIVYIASPPIAHRPHALAALAAGKTVFCEKPLGVDIADSRALADAADASGRCCIVNFPLATAHAVGLVEDRLRNNALGDIKGVDIRLHFSQWPREWQIGAAGWLSRRAEGGFAREVLSHWVYLSERLFGSAELRHAMTRYPDGDGAETHLHAELDCNGLAISIAGSIGGAGPDMIEFTIWGSQQSCQIYDWNRLRVSDGGPWREEMTEIADARQHGYRQHLDRAAAAFAGENHAMASFRDALTVQILIEAMLARN
jgi:predicted dehydrogenase